MNAKTIWIALFAGFAGINVYAALVGDLAALGEYLRGLGPWGILATADLLIALLLGVVWMWRDARLKGVAPLPYALLTVATGSLGLLLYLLRHDGMPRRASAAEHRARSAA
jgi:hypothetical protein